MSNINLSFQFSHPDAVSHFVQYARIDNTSEPNWITVVPNPVTSPAIIATNIPDGQYQIKSTPIYADGRSCQPTVFTTDPCPPLVSLSAYTTGGFLVVQYNAPASAPKVRITVNYPNGGSNTANYVNDGNPISLSIPTNVFGDFVVSGQTVCDEASGFYSVPSPPATVTIANATVRITSSAPGITVNTLTGISGFTLTQNVTTGVEVTGTHLGFTGVITFTFTGTPAFNSNATMEVNGNPIQCVNIPNTSGGTVSFNSAAFAQTDLIEIFFNTGTC